jgi:hypothetical protein
MAEALLGGWYLPPAFDPHRQLAAVMTHAQENACG